MKNRIALIVAVVVVFAAIVYTRLKSVGAAAQPSGPTAAAPRPDVSATSAPIVRVSDPAVSATPTAAPAEVPAGLVENGPPPLSVLRCAALARLLADAEPDGPTKAGLRRTVAEFDAAIGAMRRAGIVSAGSGDSSRPDPEGIAHAEAARADAVGPRRAEWLRETYARCAEDVLDWVAKVGGPLVPAEPPTH